MWAALIVSTTGSVKYIKVVNNKWEFNNELQTKIQELVSKSKPKILVNKKIIARKIGRNDPCPCNSGKKYKKCCLR